MKRSLDLTDAKPCVNKMTYLPFLACSYANSLHYTDYSSFRHWLESQNGTLTRPVQEQEAVVDYVYHNDLMKVAIKKLLIGSITDLRKYQRT